MHHWEGPKTVKIHINEVFQFYHFWAALILLDETFDYVKNL